MIYCVFSLPPLTDICRFVIGAVFSTFFCQSTSGKVSSMAAGISGRGFPGFMLLSVLAAVLYAFTYWRVSAILMKCPGVCQPVYAFRLSLGLPDFPFLVVISTTPLEARA